MQTPRRIPRALAGAAVVLAFAQVGCIVRRPLAAPSQSGARWMEHRSRHFTLATDLDPDQAEGVIRTFEHTYALLARVVFGGRETPDFQTQVVAFRSEGELREFVPVPFTGQYRNHLPNDVQSSPTMLIFGGLSPSNRILFTHELAHRFNHAVLPSMPVWLNEGLAQFYSTVRGDVDHPVTGDLDPDDGFASGSVRSDPNHVVFQGELLASNDLPPPSTLMRFDRATFYAGDLGSATGRSWKAKESIKHNYAASWAFVHMLLEESPHGAALQHTLQDPAGRSGLADALRTLAQAGPDLDREFALYLKKALPWREHHEGDWGVTVEIQRRELAEAEVLVWWTRLDSFLGGSAERAERNLRRAASDAPQDPDVLFWLGREEAIKGRPREAEQHYLQALAQRPERPSYQLALALLYLDDATGSTWSASERETLLARAVDRLGEIAATASELNAVAGYQLIQMHAPKALPFAAKACRVQPDCWECYHTYAAATSQTGDPAGAAALERTALERLPEDAPARTARVLKRAFDRYEEAVAHPGSAGREKALLFLSN